MRQPDTPVDLPTRAGQARMIRRSIAAATAPARVSTPTSPTPARSPSPSSPGPPTSTTPTPLRGGHLDVCVLGAFQVSATGDLANWHTGARDAIPAVGGAMDLAIGAKRVWVMMTLLDKFGSPKLVPDCTYPLTGVGCIDRVSTDLATFAIGPDDIRVLDAHGITPGELAEPLAPVQLIP